MNATKPIARVVCLLALAICHLIPAQKPPSTLALGSPAPAFQLQGVDGKFHTLSEYSVSRVLVVAFLCNHCTESQLYEERLEKIAEDYRAQGVALVAIQSSNPNAVPDEELAYSDVGDSLADMKIRASYRHFTFPYLYDGDTQKTARAFGAVAAPQIFIFDERRMLRYEGRIDDNARESLVKSKNARNAIDALLGGSPVAEPKTEIQGCAIRWKSPHDDATSSSSSETTTLALAGVSELHRLRTNNTGNLLLVNFYATWCGPCVSEFPDLMATNRMYRNRGFTLTTVSSNEPEERPDVLKFLQKMHADSTNLLFATTDTYALQAAFDPNMGAAVPFTVLIAPNGDIVFQQQGDLDIMDLRRAILANLPDDAGHEGAQKYWSAK